MGTNNVARVRHFINCSRSDEQWPVTACFHEQFPYSRTTPQNSNLNKLLLCFVANSRPGGLRAASDVEEEDELDEESSESEGNEDEGK